MEPATYTLTARSPVDPGVLQRILARANEPTAGPPIAVKAGAELLTFTCATWRPILVARLDDAIEAELGGDQAQLAAAERW